MAIGSYHFRFPQPHGCLSLLAVFVSGSLFLGTGPLSLAAPTPPISAADSPPRPEAPGTPPRTDSGQTSPEVPDSALESIETPSESDPESIFTEGTVPWFPPPANPLDSLTPAQRRTYVGLLTSALKSGIHPGRAPTSDEQQRALEALRKAGRLCEQDPRLPYAAGLIALANHDWSAAEQHFTRAEELSPRAHLGASIGLIYAQLARHELPQAGRSCQVLARQLAEQLAPTSEAAPSPLHQVAARWLGKAVACCAGESAHAAEALDPQVLAEQLPPSLRPDFQRGYDTVAPRHAQLLSWTRLSANELAEQARPQREELERQLAQHIASEKSAIARRKELRDSLAAELKTLTKPLVLLANKLKAEQNVARAAERRMRELAAANAIPYRSKNKPTRDPKEADRAYREELEDLRRDQQQRARREQELNTLRQQQQQRLGAITEMERLLAAGREARRQVEATNAEKLRTPTAAVDAAQRSRAEASERLNDLQAALGDRSQLLSRLRSPQTWLPLHLAGQRETLILSLKEQ
ncbi:MAG: hypothetical protein ACKO3P_00925 [Planctomycetaceae bacterium]